ncbi:HutD family protein [Noviherbaspirillum cavernae]|uniref:HutD family protein n=1 Tax=Noviherbaspirillum cavernae TaxID=2320862 RepID=A0A418X3G2_9BURK|nr:HutD family protein [Noviherbaspirillum cavernae]RJG06976.1 HutD family protein [Noviherbaspirillum cavernae]
MRKFDASNCKVMPWKNGGGITTEIAIEPADATLDNFEWRISSAQVATSGPFSHFPEIDRSLAVLEGSGLQLRVDDAQQATLTAASTPFVFRGEQGIEATLLDGPITDFNVMTRRTRWTHALERLQFCGDTSLARRADQVFIYCARGADIACSNALGQGIALDAGDSVLVGSTDGEQIQLSSASPADLYIAHLSLQEAKNAR